MTGTPHRSRLKVLPRRLSASLWPAYDGFMLSLQAARRSPRTIEYCHEKLKPFVIWRELHPDARGLARRMTRRDNATGWLTLPISSSARRLCSTMIVRSRLSPQEEAHHVSHCTQNSQVHVFPLHRDSLGRVLPSHFARIGPGAATCAAAHSCTAGGFYPTVYAAGRGLADR